MAGLEVVFGAGGITVEFGGKKYQASPLKLADFAEFRAWIRDEKLTSFMRAAKKAVLSPKQFSAGVDAIADAPMKIGRDEEGNLTADDPMALEMTTETGLRYLLWRSLLHKHPKVRLEDIDLEYAEIAQVIEVVTKLTGLSIPVEEDDEDSEKTGTDTDEKEGAEANSGNPL